LVLGAWEPGHRGRLSEAQRVTNRQRGNLAADWGSWVLLMTEQSVPAFGTCGIRGIVGESITDEVVERVGGAVARHLGPFRRVCVGRDTRRSSPDLEGKLVEGLCGHGLDVTRLGMVHSPGLYLLTRELRADLGIMVTASHNPPEYNGFKFCNSAGMCADQDALEKGYHDPPSFEGVFPGRIDEISGIDVLFAWLRDSCPAPLKPQKLVVDCACGPVSELLPELLSEQGHEIVTCNCALDIEQCDRDPEPMPSTLEKTVALVRETGADGGICLDGDGDRVVFLDREGCIGFQRANAIMSKIALEQFGGGEVVGSVETGRYVEEAVIRAGGKLWRTIVGDINIAREVRKRQAVIGVEECGHYILPKMGYFSSTIYASTFLLANRDINTIRDELAFIPEFFATEKRIDCPEEKKRDVMAAVTQRMLDMDGRPTRIDGMRMDWDDGWLLVRPSGTSPYMKVNAEAISPRRLEELTRIGLSLVEEAIA